jgi:hypothetical protein
MCVTTDFAIGDPPAVIQGDHQISAHINWNPLVAPADDQRGCAGQRKTPSGCVSWAVDTSGSLSTSGYLLTHLYDSPPNSKTYPFTWHTEDWPNGIHTLYAQITLGSISQPSKQVTVSVPITVDIENPPGTTLTSPVAFLNGNLPTFVQTTPYVIAATGDGAAGSSMAQKVGTMIQGWNPNLLMYLGDVYQRGSREEFENFYQPVFGPMADITVPTVGNHEYKTWTTSSNSPADGYFWYWGYPRSAPPNPRDGGEYYSFNAGGWHIISLDANILPTNGATLFKDTPQGQWLYADLAADTHRCTLAFWHQERFSDVSLRWPAASAFWIPLYAHNVDLIINAHVHAYERWQPLNAAGALDKKRGMTQFVVGTAGNVLSQDWQTHDSRSAFRLNRYWGALKLTLHPGYAQYAFYSPVWNPNGDGDSNSNHDATIPMDAGVVPCH